MTIGEMAAGESPDPSLPQLAVAITTVGTRFALQHRDGRPDVAWGGYWGLFGGAMEAGETPPDAIARELHEELTLRVADCRWLWSMRHYRDWLGRLRHVHVFHADLTALWSSHELREGQGSGVFPADALPQATVPSARAIIERFIREHSTCPQPD